MPRVNFLRERGARSLRVTQFLSAPAPQRVVWLRTQRVASMDKRDTMVIDKPVRKEGQAPIGVGTDPRSRWPEPLQRSRGRQAAITRNLYTWSNYKSWADKVRSTWDAEPKK